jgi:hypothetical protein
MNSAKALGEINFGLLNRLMQQQVEMMGICLEGGVQQLRVLSEAEDMKSFLHKEASLTEEVGKKALTNLQGTWEVFEGAKGQWVEWADNNFNKLNELHTNVQAA